MSLRLSPAVAALVAIAALPCAVAQSSLDEVVVTATGRQADTHETPATADARFGWRFGRVGGLSAASIDLRFLNLFDRQYHEHLTDGISGRELPAPGRGVLISFSAES